MDDILDLLLIKEADKTKPWIDKFVEIRKFANIKESTIRQDTQRLKVFLNYCINELEKNPDELEFNDFIKFFKYLQEERQCSINTQDHYYKLLSVFYKVMFLKNSSEYLKFKKYCKDIGKFRKYEVEHYDELTPEEVNEIIKYIINSNSATKVRDAVIIRLTYDTGARIGETLNLKLKDCDFKKGVFKFKNTKGREVREAVCAYNTLKALKHYMEYYMKSKKSNDYLFQNKYGSKVGDYWIRKVFNRTVKELVDRGIIPKNKHITLHSLRHGRVVDLLNKGYGLDIVGDYVGHKDIKTTMVYAHSNSRKKKILKEIQRDLDRGTK
jgi:integrase/recombinase XerD